MTTKQSFHVACSCERKVIRIEQSNTHKLDRHKVSRRCGCLNGSSTEMCRRMTWNKLYSSDVSRLQNKELLHSHDILHNKYLPVWVRIWALSWLCVLYFFLQFGTLHSNGFSPLWVRRWVVKSVEVREPFPHNEHIYLLSPVCVNWCVASPLPLENVCSKNN